MISRRKLPELRTYIRAEARLPFRSEPVYGSLVVPNGNESQPVHGWFKYKEAFSADLLSHVLSHLDLGLTRGSSIKLLDPFCGVGTSLVSAQLLKPQAFSVEATGIECNPFSAFVARTKASWPLVDPGTLRNLASQVLARGVSTQAVSLPRLSSIKSGRCISRHAARQVLYLRDQLRALKPSIERDVLMVGLAACIEPISRVRRDGRALRLVTKRRCVLRKLLADRWESMALDVEALRKSRPKASQAKVILGDGRRLQGVDSQSVDLILTSPPYPNNIDYNEVYKLELWLLGFVTTDDAFLTLRRRTFRSHPTCRPLHEKQEFDENFLALTQTGSLADLLGMVIRRAESLERQHRRGRSKVLLGYLYDTWRSMRAHFEALKRGACAVYVIGNSLHGGSDRPYLVPTDLILARLGEHVGFSVEDLIVARPLPRRLSGNHFLRDSVLVFRKP